MRYYFLLLNLLYCLSISAQDSLGAVVDTTIANTHTISAKVDSLQIGNTKVYLNLKEEEDAGYADWLVFIAAIIVAYGAYRGVIKQSMASSVSGFRVGWIEDLRVCYSKFLIALRNVDTKIRTGELDVRRYSNDEDLEQVQFLRTKIKLMLNHNESEHVAFWEALTQYMIEHRNYHRGELSDTAENALDRRRVDMEQLLLTIFKKEWDKAKSFG